MDGPGPLSPPPPSHNSRHRDDGAYRDRSRDRGRDGDRDGRDWRDKDRPGDRDRDFRRRSSSRDRGGAASRRHVDPSDRPTPDPCPVLGVFGLSILTSERDLDRLFSPFGRIQDITILFDKQTNKSRGFGFITFEDTDAAAKAREAMNGYDYNDRRMRVDFSLTKRGHDSTPGQYMGRPDQVRNDGRHRNDRFDRGGGGRGGYDRDYRGGGGGGYRDDRDRDNGRRDIGDRERRDFNERDRRDDRLGPSEPYVDRGRESRRDRSLSPRR
ncbi:transformer 2 beta [Entophlyctis luteolus]|nr:transformer 2 beta [Entophlyctis luteolus]